MLNRIEYEGMVVDNVDPLAKGRLRIFIFGLHDISENKIPIDYLPWAFSSYPTNSTTIPEIGSVVKVKFRLDDNGRNNYNLQHMEWIPTSHYNKLKSNKDPRNFLLYDSNTQKFYESTGFLTNESINKNNTEIKELEFQRDEKQSQLESNRKDLINLENQLNIDNNDITNKKNQVDNKLKSLLDEYNTNLNSVNNRLNQKIQEVTNSFDNHYNTNIKPTIGNISIDDLYNTNRSEYNRYLDQYISSQTTTLIIERDGIQAKYKSDYDSYSSEQNILSKQISSTNSRQVELNNSKIEIQKEIDRLSKEITDLNFQILDKKTSDTSGKSSVDSFENAKSLDSRITRLDEITGKVYGLNDKSEEVLIGNWNGAYLVIPGYAGQLGRPLWDRITNSNIKPESYLSRSDNFAKERPNVSTDLGANNPAIKASDNDKTWNCDLSYEVRMKILSKRNSVLNAVKWLRDKISSLFSSFSSSAIGQSLKAAVNQLTAILKSAQKFLKFVNDVIIEIGKITAQIRQLITWILSLPARLLVLLQDCLTHFFDSISQTLSGSFKFAGSDVKFADVSELIDQAKKTFQTATETVEGATIVYTEIKAISATVEKV